ncbi:hypothetical protein CAPTEDRAFT_194852 [Capitella teleta]|uniref:Iodothyronine deiodinase n=1 Tax=Capitella teleta TaxID=283909 RepID=R7T3L4_CAPTE|nr:hypothetical protein CAPTEDRAFT_194852 [Capitella teleta]|eukprot:ELT87211.1 hypothetical protein CAPTEDRAFT_194852 [Capitella teleta]
MGFKFNQLMKRYNPFYVGLWVIISYLKMAVIVSILKVLYSIPRLGTTIALLRRRHEEDYFLNDADFMKMQLECTTLEAWRGMSWSETVDRLKTVHMGAAIEDVPLFSLEGKPKFCRIADEMREQVDFLAVYVEEAHPDDGHDFSYKNGFEVMQAKVLEERLASAKAMAEHLGGMLKFPVVVDSMQNDAMYAYGARPERLYIVLDGLVVYQSHRGPYYVNFEEFESELRAMVKMQ